MEASKMPVLDEFQKYVYYHKTKRGKVMSISSALWCDKNRFNQFKSYLRIGHDYDILELIGKKEVDESVEYYSKFTQEQLEKIIELKKNPYIHKD